MFKLKVDLLNGNILKSVLLFALPLLISNFFQQLYNTIDTMIVGNYLGDVSLAAIGASTPVYDLLIGFALGIGNGLSIVTARSYGAMDEDKIKKSVAGSIVIGAVVTVVVMALCSFLLYPLLELLNTPEAIIDEAYSYIFVITIAIGVTFLYNLCAGLLRAIGNSVMPLVFLILSALLNVVLDLLLITQFDMGIQGAAVATVIAQGVSGVLCIFYILRKAKILVPHRVHFNVGSEMYKDLWSQGLSMGFMMAIVSSGTLILQYAINELGYLTIAAHTGARKLTMFFMIPVSSLAMSISTFVSQNKGANQMDRVRKSVFYANMLSIGWGIIISVLMLILARPLIQILSGSSEAIVIDNGAKYLMINAPFFGVLGIVLNVRNALQGLGSKTLPLVSSIIEFIGKIIFVVILIPEMGYMGVILCEPLIWCAMGIQLMYSFYKSPNIQEMFVLAEA
ncbi:MATE family efflux transporter [Breznakia pachnodae]|uniref:MATE family efflux protein n=1 Tax=Breznakia pachnodae TaxID=265178 RepID=A0ABU0E851_9FIRM|nr:MATE family efflux transporter [Breznakia pachnodae]MDQ0363055.1 putative MATE family efflux protein [Breznakia pachnodae]